MSKYLIFSDLHGSIESLEIIIETSYYQAVYPVEKYVVGSFVGKFCQEKKCYWIYLLMVWFYVVELK